MGRRVERGREWRGGRDRESDGEREREGRGREMEIGRETKRERNGCFVVPNISNRQRPMKNELLS